MPEEETHMDPKMTARFWLLGLLIAVALSSQALTSIALAAQAEMLTGPNVIRRSSPDAEQESPQGDGQRSVQNRTHLDTIIVDGRKLSSGNCEYALRFTDEWDDLTQKLVWMAAVDPELCKFEFQIDEFEPRVSAPDPDADSHDKEARGARDEYKGEPEPWEGRRYAHPDVFVKLREGLQDSTIALARRDTKLTVVGRWQDPANVNVNKVLVAVRADTNGNDITSAGCKYAWWWLRATGWQNAGDDDTDCRKNRRAATGMANGHFQNPYFPTCLPDVVHVYYDRLWAKVSPRGKLDSGHYDWGIRATWADGARCKGMLHWASFEVIKGEYSTGWINGVKQ
jgi:hypothetical protein